jgi:YrbI family 3-deoxy-D-manno-octulosonate 8-phosphate phosphatase
VAVTAAVRRRARAVRLLVLDVDGVLTDGAMYYAESGDEWKRFNTRDGQGLALIRAAGVHVAIVTREHTAIVTRRAAKLQIEDVHQGVTDKLAVVRELAARHDVTRDTICYVGDDVGDLEAMRWVGFAVAVADALPAIRRVAHWVTPQAGGQGAVRDVCELILTAQRRVVA